MQQTLTGETKRHLLLAFRRAGFAAVQKRLGKVEASSLFGEPEIPGARALARWWLVEQMEKNRRKRQRNKMLLVTGVVLGLVTAALGMLVLRF